MTTSEFNNWTVLIVEDERGLASLYETWLADTHDVRVANSGEEALDKVDDGIDVVLLDRRMPEMSGDQVVDRIRDCDFECQIVIVTAVTPDFDIADLRFDEYLVKPVDGEDIRNAVTRAIRRATDGDTIKEYQRLLTSHAILEAEKSDVELAMSDEYTELEERIADLRSEINARVSASEEDDHDAAYQND